MKYVNVHNFSMLIIKTSHTLFIHAHADNERPLVIGEARRTFWTRREHSSRPHTRAILNRYEEKPYRVYYDLYYVTF